MRLASNSLEKKHDRIGRKQETIEGLTGGGATRATVQGHRLPLGARKEF
jgi:hypothetical protein